MACSSVKCIADVFQNDGILNCPPPGCSDEIGCKNNETSHVVYVEIDDSYVPPSATELYIVMSLVVVIVCSLICLIFCCKKRKPTVNSQQRNNNERPHPSVVSDFDSYLEFQSVRPTTLAVPESQHERATQSAPRVGFITDPPTYDALFDANAHKRAPEPIIKKF